MQHVLLPFEPPNDRVVGDSCSARQRIWQPMEVEKEKHPSTWSTAPTTLTLESTLWETNLAIENCYLWIIF